MIFKTPLSSNRSKGYITLVSILIIGAVGFSISISLISSGLGNSRTSFALEQSAKAKGLADACAEFALKDIRQLASFIGTKTIHIGDNSCTYSVVHLGENTNDKNIGGHCKDKGKGHEHHTWEGHCENLWEEKQIMITSTFGSVTRRSEIFIKSIPPLMNILSWQDVADF